MTTAQPNFVFGEDTEPRRFVYQDVAYNHQVKKATQSPLLKPIGVSHEGTRIAPIPEISTNYCALSGETARVYGPGETCEIDVSATLAVIRGDILCPDASSKAQPGVDGMWACARALDSAAAAGKVRAIIIDPMKVDRKGEVLVKDADYTVTLRDLGKTFQNTGATGAVDFALPAAVVGMTVRAQVMAAQILSLSPNGTETVALPSTGVQAAAGKYITANAVGEGVELHCSIAGTWDVVTYTGTWTAEA